MASELACLGFHFRATVIIVRLIMTILTSDTFIQMKQIHR